MDLALQMNPDIEDQGALGVSLNRCDHRTEKENLCLYGFPNENWEVALPAEEVPPELPEPALGINFARDGMQEKDWLSLVAVHSDAWLLAVAFYFGARFGFDKAERKRLFGMINDLPTIYEVVNGKNKVRTLGTNHSAKKFKSNTKVQRALEPLVTKHQKAVQQLKDGDADVGPAEEEADEDGAAEGEEDHGDTPCGACGDNYTSDEFWICCDYLREVVPLENVSRSRLHVLSTSSSTGAHQAVQSAHPAAPAAKVLAPLKSNVNFPRSVPSNSQCL